MGYSIKVIRRLKTLSDEVDDTLYLVMRVSFEKARQFLLDIAEIGLVSGEQSIPADLVQLKYGFGICCRVGCGAEMKRSSPEP